VSEEPANLNHGVRPPGDVNPRHDPPLDFPDAPFGALTRSDYDTLGFLSGLEVHQQIRTRSKLFCRCPAGHYVDTYDAAVLRHMRPTLSELGEYDGTALMEFKTKKEIVYQLERSSVCTYEIDDTPPFEIDDEAVHVAIEIASLLDLNLVSELHVMRKQYLDGSIPTGFQRTAMVGLTGSIPFRVPELGVDRELRIRQLSLEEDSCREIADVGHRITFRTDRLGMPLTETVTEPDLRTPEELQAGARLAARVAQATGKVRRGPGAARQDVNVSIAGGRRVEIKGVHHHRRLPQLVHIEAFRQLNLLRVRAALAAREVTGDGFALPAKGAPWELSPLVAEVSRLVADASYGPLRAALERGDTIVAVRLPGYGGLLAHRTQPGRTFGYELEERVRVIACPVHRPFLVHSDEPDSPLAGHLWRALRSELRAGADDALVVAWAPATDAATAAREILLRAQEAVVGVPAETRQAFPDGTTGFERVLPGPDRMYPDTDTPPLPIPDAVVTRIQSALPETPWARERRYEQLGLAARPARRLASAPWADLFDAITPQSAAVRVRLAAALEKRLPFHARTGHHVAPTAERLRPLVQALDAGTVRLEATDRALDELLAADAPAPDTVIARFLARPDDEDRLDRRISDVVAVAGSEPALRDPETALRWAMGQVMPVFLGRVAPEAVRGRLAAAFAVSTTEAAR
jgi:glutamyl-tRNA(Gln) amidotransferase subunit E